MWSTVSCCCPLQVNHLGGVKRVAAQNSMALKIMTAAARKEAEQPQQAQQAQQPAEQAPQPAVQAPQAQQEQQRASDDSQQSSQAQRAEQAQQERDGKEQQEQQGRKAPAFNVSWDFKPSLQSSVSMFYPVIALRSAAAASAEQSAR
jgi:hypothetical protein